MFAFQYQIELEQAIADGDFKSDLAALDRALLDRHLVIRARPGGADDFGSGLFQDQGYATVLSIGTGAFQASRPGTGDVGGCGGQRQCSH